MTQYSISFWSSHQNIVLVHAEQWTITLSMHIGLRHSLSQLWGGGLHTIEYRGAIKTTVRIWTMTWWRRHSSFQWFSHGLSNRRYSPLCVRSKARGRETWDGLRMCEFHARCVRLGMSGLAGRCRYPSRCRNRCVWPIGVPRPGQLLPFWFGPGRFLVSHLLLLHTSISDHHNPVLQGFPS